MPARATGKFILSMNAKPTRARCTPAQVAEAAHALQLQATDADIKSLAGSIVGAALVAIVANMADAGGTFMAVELDPFEVAGDNLELRA